MANAVLDGVDGILLGAETVRGLHPRATVETILHICKQAEKVFDFREHFDRMMLVRLLGPQNKLGPAQDQGLWGTHWGWLRQHDAGAPAARQIPAGNVPSVSPGSWDDRGLLAEAIVKTASHLNAGREGAGPPQAAQIHDAGEPALITS